MSTQLTHTQLRNTVATKRCRITKKAGSSALPVGRHLIVKGKTSTHSCKAFSFAVLSSTQQMKERNKAYHFFSID